MKNSHAEANRWLRQAENDLGAARVMQREGFFAQACFLAHQVAEKALKALAYNRGDRYVIGHSLTELVSDLATIHPAVSELQVPMGVLDQYYLPTRYPDALPGSTPFEVFSETQARDAVDAAETTFELAESIISS